jgi:hypothetical protein
MAETPEQMAAFIARLCEDLKVPDQAALMETPEFHAKYAEEHNKAPTVSEKSLMGKALKGLRYVTEKGIDLQAHCIEPRYEFIEYDKDAPGKGRDRFICTAIGVLVATPDGRTKRIKMADRDPAYSISEQFESLKLPESLTRGSPVTLNAVDTRRDRMTGEVDVTLTKASRIIPGGHNNPFPEGPDLEYVLGSKAAEKQIGAFKVRDHKLNGSFGDIRGDPTSVALTVTSDKTLIKVRNFEDDSPSDWHVAAPCSDRRGNKVGTKFSAEHLAQLGLDFSMPRETIAAELAGKRFFGRGFGSIFMPKSPEDFGTVKAIDPDTGQEVEKLYFDVRVDELKAEGLIQGYGDGTKVQLVLKDRWLLDENNNRVPQHYVMFGDKRVYSLMQKKGGWEISVLADDEKKNPWMSFNSKSGTFQKDDGGEGSWESGRNCFIVFLDGTLLGGSELSEDDPFLNAVGNLPVPSFISSMKKTAQQSIPQAR